MGVVSNVLNVQLSETEALIDAEAVTETVGEAESLTVGVGVLVLDLDSDSVATGLAVGDSLSDVADTVTNRSERRSRATNGRRFANRRL